MNDRDRHIVARNAIILLLMVTIDNTKVLSECVLHVWYSAFIRQDHLDLMNRHVLPLIQDVCEKIEDESKGSLHSEKWQFGRCTLCFELDKEAWQTLLSCLTVRSDITLEDARQIRRAVVNRPEHADFRDYIAIRQLPAHRLSRRRFDDDGILLPFGNSRELFVIPNP